MKAFPLCLLLTALVAAPTALTTAAESPPAAPAAAVSVAEATSMKLAPTRWVPGSVVSRDDARIAGVASGRVIEIAEVGSVIKKGERLAKLDDVSLRLRLEQARATAGRAKAQRDLAQTQMSRLAKLAPGNAVAQTQLDEARATLEGASQELARTDA